MKKRIVITGMGVVSCFGCDIDLFYDSLLRGESGITPISGFSCDDYPTRFAGEIAQFDSGSYIDKKQARRIDKFIAYAMVAGKKALESGGIDPAICTGLQKERCGILIGSGMGGMATFAEGVHTLEHRGNQRVSPFLVPYIITNMAGGMLAIDLGFMGPNYSISTACATANNAIIAAANHILEGDADLMLCGGSEAAITPLGVAAFCSCKALSRRNDQPTRASRPWDKSRDGFVIGEGSGIILLEELEHARRRNAPIIAEYLGGGLSCDASHITEPRQDFYGIARCLKQVLEKGNIDADQVNYINAHATSTPAGDMAEIAAIKQVLPNPKQITLNATKSMIGHCLGAAGGMEAIAVLQAIKRSVVHPTINIEQIEEGCCDFQVPRQATELNVRIALSNSFGFGGHNATIAFAPFKG